jgi:hypothetical protein
MEIKMNKLSGLLIAGAAFFTATVASAQQVNQSRNTIQINGEAQRDDDDWTRPNAEAFVVCSQRYLDDLVAELSLEAAKARHPINDDPHVVFTSWSSR